jgi:hypothetical protein
MWVRLEVRDRFGDFLGDLPSEPVVIGEYEAYPLHFVLRSDQAVETFALQIGGRWLERGGNVFYFGTGESEHGRRGDIPVRIFHYEQHVATGHIIITGISLSETQYRYLIHDLKRLVTLASADETTVRGMDAEPELQFLTFYDRQLQEIGQCLDDLKATLAEIEQAPQRTVVKQYHLKTEMRVHRIDGRTIRWRAIHGAQTQGRVQTYTNIESYDVYENQFIVYVLNRLQRYLVGLTDSFTHSVDQKIEDVSRRIRDWESYGEIEGEKGIEERRIFKKQQLGNLRNLKAQLEVIEQERVPRYRFDTDTFLRRIDELLQLPFLFEVRPSLTFTVEPTLVLLRDPGYNAVYEGYRHIQQTLQLDERQQIESLLERVPIERTSKLYEYWVFLQVYVELRRMGFGDAEGSLDIQSLVDKNTFRLKPNTCLHLLGDPASYTYREKTVEACLFYERRFGPTDSFSPDIFIEFTLGSAKAMVMDAKYRCYDAPGCPEYEHDVTYTAYHRYKRLERYSGIDDQWIEVKGIGDLRSQIAASFVVHSHPDEERFLDYGSAGHSNEYGAIPLVPEEPVFNLTNLRRLLKMFMRMHLHLFDICWSAMHSRPVKATPIQELGGEYREWWEWEYRCPVCGNRWWVNHCGICGRERHMNVPKITFSDPSDNFFEFDKARMMGNKRLLKCSTCNQAYLHHGRGKK